MADLTLTLGDITFGDLEVPERIAWGTLQQLVTHKLVGGKRVIDAMGVDFEAMEWSGWILGPDAVARAQNLDAMATSGLPQSLTWSSFNYQVVVRSFKATFERFYQIPYRITLEVVSNNTQPVITSETPPIDDAVMDDNSSADAMVLTINDSILSSLMAVVDSLIAGA
jgi:hypothetical protein